MTVTLNIEKRSFIAENETKIEYYAYEAEIGGETIAFHPRKEDKKLLEHILGKCDFQTASTAETPKKVTVAKEVQ